MTVPTVLATTARRNCRLCSASESRSVANSVDVMDFLRGTTGFVIPDLDAGLAGCRKSGILGPDMGYNARCVTRCGGTPDARGDVRGEALFSYLSCDARV